jgi:hypothetical protein
MIRRGLGGVYSRGLHDSLAFKLAAYLAASKCLVAQGIVHAVPLPLVAGKDYMASAIRMSVWKGVLSY